MKYRYDPFPFPFLCLPLTSPPYPPPSLPLEVGPLNPARGSEHWCKLPQQDAGWSPRYNAFLAFFSPRKCIWMEQFQWFPYRYGSRPERSGGMISSRPQKCRYIILVHAISLQALHSTHYTDLGHFGDKLSSQSLDWWHAQSHWETINTQLEVCTFNTQLSPTHRGWPGSVDLLYNTTIIDVTHSRVPDANVTFVCRCQQVKFTPLDMWYTGCTHTFRITHNLT